MSVGNVDVGAALAKVEAMLRRDRSISPAARGMFELLVLIINLMMAKLGVNSSNSGIAPSKDPGRPRGAKPRTQGTPRKPGGQKGHRGTTLEWTPEPDRVEPLSIDRRTIPPGQYSNAGYDARQVVDIVIAKSVVEYRAEILENAKGDRFVAQFPAAVTQRVQYGPGVKSQSVYHSQQQLTPYDRIREYFQDQCGLPVSAGSVFNFNLEAFDRLEPFESFLIEKLISQPVLHADETGIQIDKKLHWLHCLCNDRWTMFFPHTDRGAEADKAMGVLPLFKGKLGHDHWKAYFRFGCDHFLCNAHHLRQLEYASAEDHQRWAVKMKSLLLEIHRAVKDAGGALGSATAARFRRRYRGILTRADRECPARPPKPGTQRRVAQTKSRNLLERLRDFETETLRFMTDPLVPFTNNPCENDLRMTKVQQKISGCFRSFQGAQIFCRVRGFISTCRKHGIAATVALQALFEGKLSEIIKQLEAT